MRTLNHAHWLARCDFLGYSTDTRINQRINKPVRSHKLFRGGKYGISAQIFRYYFTTVHHPELVSDVAVSTSVCQAVLFCARR